VYDSSGSPVKGLPSQSASLAEHGIDDGRKGRSPHRPDVLRHTKVATLSGALHPEHDATADRGAGEISAPICAEFSRRSSW
jgi:hypothetical protein